MNMQIPYYLLQIHKYHTVFYEYANTLLSFTNKQVPYYLSRIADVRVYKTVLRLIFYFEDSKLVAQYCTHVWI